MRKQQCFWPLITAVLVTVLLPLGGCSDDDPTAVDTPGQAPTLPDPGLLTFDFSFFDQGEELKDAKAQGQYSNFIQAYLRAALLDLMAHLVLAPPVAAFSLALHTPASPQDDGSWIWVYTYVDGDEEARIRLRGLPRGASVEWELYVTASQHVPPLDNALWFEGTTSDDGETGSWTFYDLEDPEQPVAGEIAWGSDDEGRYLRFTSHEPGEDGNTLTFRDSHPDYSIVFVDPSANNEWFIRWNSAGYGSLLVPDYNGGELACWDESLQNVTCP